MSLTIMTANDFRADSVGFTTCVTMKTLTVIVMDWSLIINEKISLWQYS